jgi:carboxyl-terminal processing protease
MKKLHKSLQTITRFRYLFILVAIAIGLSFSQRDQEVSKKDRIIIELIYKVLSASHFAPQDINDEFSAKVYHDFIEDIDFSKRFFLQSDLDLLRSHELEIDDQIKNTELDFFEETYGIYQTRLSQSKTYAFAVLDQPFDFERNEELETDDEKQEFAASQEELEDRWRKYLKLRTLSRLEEMITENAEEAEKFDSIALIAFDSLELKARLKVKETHEQWFDNLEDMERIDWVGAFMNTITGLYDPHTAYFPPERKEDFEVSMTGQITGIGAQLQQKGDYVSISKIITGSPCWKQGDLEVGDKILKVAQGADDKEPIDMVGMKVRKAVNYIRGEKGTEVILTVRKLDGQKMDIPIIRDVVELESTFAKSAILGEGDDKMGYIRLPKFYVNFYGDANHDCAEDVRAELEKLKSENVKGVILDLRNNGGGSLQGVIDIVGLFIKEGPVVQVKAPGRKPQVLKDDNNDLVYDGPLVVMTNRFSASASEIFAAAIQDYKRGIIVGSQSTFGKGTVQNVLDMDRAVGANANDVKPLGALKLTIQKYYRINGGTPQLRGVTPDVVLPDNYRYTPVGESEQDYALPYDEIASADYKTWINAATNLKQVQANSAKRVKNNDKFQLIEDYAAWVRDERENTVITLNYQDYKQAREEYRQKAERYKDMRASNDTLVVSANQADEVQNNATEEAKVKAEKWHKSMSTDLLLQEALAIIKDVAPNS